MFAPLRDIVRECVPRVLKLEVQLKGNMDSYFCKYEIEMLLHTITLLLVL
jgi:hypothetical protein